MNETVAASMLPPRLHELVHYRVAHINGCLPCQTYRASAAQEAGISDADLAEVVEWRSSPRFDELERLAIDFAERFCSRPGDIDDDLTEALRTGLGDDGLVDLTVSVATYLAAGRLITVLDLDQSCDLPLHVQGT